MEGDCIVSVKFEYKFQVYVYRRMNPHIHCIAIIAHTQQLSQDLSCHMDNQTSNVPA